MDRDMSESSRPATSVHVAASTWARNSHNLFDFEAHHEHQAIIMPQPGACVRYGNDVEVLDERAAQRPGAELLLRLAQRADGGFSVGREKASSSDSKLWVVVREGATQRYDLSEGDVVKLGRVKFRISQLVPEEGVWPNLHCGKGERRPCAPIGGAEASAACRICLMEGSSDEDPLISPCQCAGSIKHVHLGCLRRWIKERLRLPEGPCNSYCYRPPTCELCTASYPALVSDGGGGGFPLVELPQIAPPFLVLESSMWEAGAPRGAGSALHVLSLAGKERVRLGRGHEVDVRVGDVSMSRVHASIRFHSGRFVLEDNNSKFGTLVALRKPTTLAWGNSVTLMAGRTMLALSNAPREATALSDDSAQSSGRDLRVHCARRQASSSPASAPTLDRRQELDELVAAPPRGAALLVHIHRVACFLVMVLLCAKAYSW